MSKGDNTATEESSIETFAATAEVFVEPEKTDVKIRKTPDDLVEVSMRNEMLNCVLLMDEEDAQEMSDDLAEAIGESS